MAREVSSRVMQAPQGGGGGGGGLLRSLLRPFMPEVAAGIDMADGAITALSGGGGGGLSSSLAQASKMLSGGEGGEEGGEEMSEGGVDPGEVPEVNPVMASAEDPSQDVGAEEGEELSDEQMAALRQLDQQFPGVNQELASDPSLLDGASNMVNKLRYMYRKQAGGGVA